MRLRCDEEGLTSWAIPWRAAVTMSSEVVLVGVWIVVAVAVVLLLVVVGSVGAALLAVASEVEQENLPDD